MNKHQTIFLRQYLLTGDKIAAYRLAYPKAKESSIKSAVNRLLRTNPEIEKAVREKDEQLDKEAEEQVLERKKSKYVALGEVRELLAEVIRGQALNEKIYKTREGFERLKLTPTISQKLTAANACIRLEGWAKRRPPARAEQEKQKEEKKPEGPVKYNVSIGGLPMDEYTALYAATTDAYFDPEDGSSKWWPVESQLEKLEELQQRRQARKDAERQQRMSEELKREETAALYELERRPVDEEAYSPQAKVIDTLRDEYLKEKDAGKLKELKAVQKMCGLRYLHHRHRYEAEREAGWQFHPLNNNLIRKAAGNTNIISHGHLPLQGRPGGVNTATTGNKNEDILKHTPKRQQTETNSHQSCHSERSEESPELMQAAPSQKQPNSKFLIPNTQLPIANSVPPVEQGYTLLNDLMQDEWDYYIRNQGSTTYRQLNDLKRFIAHRHDPPEIRQQIEQDTGWLYHPFEANYAKRNPKRPLVRTIFKGPPRY